MLTYPVSCGGVYGFGCNLNIVAIPPTSEQSHDTHTHTHTHIHTHTHTHIYIYCKEL